jgi:hypothetical protein
MSTAPRAREMLRADVGQRRAATSGELHYLAHDLNVEDENVARDIAAAFSEPPLTRCRRFGPRAPTRGRLVVGTCVDASPNTCSFRARPRARRQQWCTMAL